MNKLALYGGKPVRNKFLIFGSPRIEKDEINEVINTLKCGWIGTGPKCELFENKFKNYIGCKYAISLNSCTAGIFLSLLAAGIKEGDEVITSPMTFASTANCIFNIGGVPIFVDIDKKTMNIDPNLIEKKITKRTKAIIPVHFAGRPCDMDSIRYIANKYNLIIIEDAAHAIESMYNEEKIGNIGELTCFSFYVTKNITTAEGGMVTTNNKDWADRIKILALHGMSKDAWRRYSDEGFKHYQVILPGYKYNMTDIQASIGIHQLDKIEYYLKLREDIWKRYDEAFEELPIITPEKTPPNIRHSRHLYTILLKLEELEVDRDTFQNALYKENIGTGIHFISLHLHKFYKEHFGYNENSFPNSTFVSRRTISLPLSAKLTSKDVNDVIKAVKKVAKYFKRKKIY